ncbi:hypothetical protein QJS66_15705 [Kocuria rhizophila]|nr:hypothetical protein QJS66_15705 [Kocuria rhizophila]
MRLRLGRGHRGGPVRAAAMLAALGHRCADEAATADGAPRSSCSPADVPALRPALRSRCPPPSAPVCWSGPPPRSAATPGLATAARSPPSDAAAPAFRRGPRDQVADGAGRAQKGPLAGSPRCCARRRTVRRVARRRRRPRPVPARPRRIPAAPGPRGDHHRHSRLRDAGRRRADTSPPSPAGATPGEGVPVRDSIPRAPARARRGDRTGSASATLTPPPAPGRADDAARAPGPASSPDGDGLRFPRASRRPTEPYYGVAASATLRATRTARRRGTRTAAWPATGPSRSR